MKRTVVSAVLLMIASVLAPSGAEARIGPQAEPVKPKATLTVIGAKSVTVGATVTLRLKVPKGVKGQKVTLDRRGAKGPWKKIATAKLKKAKRAKIKPVTFTTKLTAAGTYKYRVRVAKKGKIAKARSKVVSVTARPAPAPKTSISAGTHRTCATNGALYCWGRNPDGLLGVAGSANRLTPGRVGTWSNWASVEVGGYHVCAITRAGALYCWGDNGDGQLGIGSASDRTEPARVGSASNWASVSAGSEHTCAITTSGDLYCWGYNGYGQLGLGDTSRRTAPEYISSGWREVSAGDWHTCGVIDTGALRCWGHNGNGRLGVGDTDGRTAPTQVPTPAIAWRSVATGDAHTCATSADGALYCWGANPQGQLGLGDTLGRLTPTQISTGTSWAAVSAGVSHTCATTTARALFCWGRNTEGQLGIGTAIPWEVKTPTRTGSAANWTAVAPGQDHTCGFTTAGVVHCWGDNDYGQLGVGGTDARFSPTKVTLPVG